MEKTLLLPDHFSIERPQPIDRLDSESYYYNFNVRATSEMQDGEHVEGFSVSVLYIEGELTPSRIMRGWLEVRYPMDQELKLLNNYNALQSGISTDAAAKDAYEGYLRDRDDFRRQLLLDFESLNKEAL